MSEFNLATAEYTVSITYTPATVYGAFRIPPGHKAIDFRQYKKGEKFLTSNGVVTAPTDEAINGIPYIILEKIPVKTIFTYDILRRESMATDGEFYSHNMDTFFPGFKGDNRVHKFVCKRIVEYL